MKYYVVDAFTKEHYRGNPAGVCVMEKWISDVMMQKIAFENNLAETAFLVKNKDHYDLRWFTPEVEIDLCGHATLASAHVLMRYIDTRLNTVSFETKSGKLTVIRDRELYLMDFPARKPKVCAKPELLEKALNIDVIETFQFRDLVAVVKDEKTLKELKPDFSLLKQIEDYFGIIVTAKGDQVDFVSRFFAPRAGIAEDPVTGSSHSSLIPFWSDRLGKDVMIARQLSYRGGELYCKNLADRVEIGGHAITHLVGEILL